MARLRGNGRDNSLAGTEGADRISGLGGTDTLFGGGGDDRLFSGADRDTLYGGDGNDRFSSGPGQDQLYGGGIDIFGIMGLDDGDLVDGGDGEKTVDLGVLRSGIGVQPLLRYANIDRLVLTDFDDEIDATFDFTGATIYGGRGNDSIDVATNGTVVYGGPGNDEIRGDFFTSNLGPDVFFGGAGADVLRGIRGDDRIYGGGGADSLFGGLGDDTVKGGGGADFLILNGVTEAGETIDVYTGGRGADIFRIVDNGGSPEIVITDLTRRDLIQMYDMTWGDFRDLPHTFRELVAAAEDTPRGVVIDLYTGAHLTLRGLTIDDLAPSNFDFFFATP